MTFTDAAAEVLRLVGKPLHYKEITDIAIEKNLLSHVGKSPEVTMGARLAATLKKDASDNPLVRVKPGVFALREWDDKTIRSGLDPKKGSRRGHHAEASALRGDHQQGDDDDAVLVGAPESEPQPEAQQVTWQVRPVTEEAFEEAAAEEASIAYAGHEASETSDESALPSEERPLDAGPARAARPSTPRGGHAAERQAPPDEERYDADPELAETEEPQGPDEAMRAEAAAGAAEMFDEEDDDDQPILGGTDDRAVAPGAEQGDGRRRRRRRRRGRTNGEATPSQGGLPSYTATPAFDARREGPPAREPNRDSNRDNNRDSNREVRDSGRGEYDRRDSSAARDQSSGEVFRPQVIELTGGDGHALDDLAGRELSDAVAIILSTFDRNAGAVSLRQIAETAQRRGRLAGDAQLVQSQVAAAVRVDNARRIAAGQRPRFRLAGGRVALTDWLLSSDLARLEQEALAAVERYRDAARRAFARKLGELPGHAFVEICVLALEALGVGQLRAIRRPGASGGETHFSGVLRAPADDLRIAVVIRRDGREVGRERVADLRGSLHHYGAANAGWILTAGQTLSGAREEASIAGTAPITLYDGLAVARLCEDNDVAVIRARLPIAIPDVDLLEALRAS